MFLGSQFVVEVLVLILFFNIFILFLSLKMRRCGMFCP